MYLNKGNPNFRHGSSVLIIKKAELLAIVSSSCVLASKKGKECLILSANETAQQNTISPCCPHCSFAGTLERNVSVFFLTTGKSCLTNMVVAKTWGQGRGVSLFSCTKNVRHLSFIYCQWQSVKKIRNILKVRKGHLSLFFQMKRISDLNWSFCGEYTLTRRDTGDSLSCTF